MKIIAVTNQKGGVGKTTTVVNLAALLGEEEPGRTLVVDMDPQAQASEHVRARVHRDSPIYEVLARGGRIEDFAAQTSYGFDILAGGEETAIVESHMITTASGRGRYALADALREVAAGRWDRVLIDCPPSLGALTMSALIAAEVALVPLELQAMSVDGLKMLTRSVDLMRRDNPALTIAAIFGTNSNMRTREAVEAQEELRAGFPEVFLEETIHMNTALSRAFRKGVPISYFEPDSAGAQDYRALLRALKVRGVL
jgi:chromosome partitioning protein